MPDEVLGGYGPRVSPAAAGAGRWTGIRTASSPARRLGLLAVSALTALAMAASVVVLVHNVGIGARAATTEVRTEPRLSPGADPFTPPAGVDPGEVAPPPAPAGTVTGNTSGLYGGTVDNAVCDAGAMVSFLQAHPDRAAAWARVEGIEPAAVPEYLRSLTPVVLRTDTAVTNHGFADGRATVVPAVLQAGTAVLVDEYGVPRARCSCGNPLTPPEPVAAPRYVGSGWSGFSPEAVTTIVPAAAPIQTFVLVDPAAQVVFERPRATGGAADRRVNAAAAPASGRTPDIQTRSGTPMPPGTPTEPSPAPASGTPTEPAAAPSSQAPAPLAGPPERALQVTASQGPPAPVTPDPPTSGTPVPVAPSTPAQGPGPAAASTGSQGPTGSVPPPTARQGPTTSARPAPAGSIRTTTAVARSSATPSPRPVAARAELVPTPITFSPGSPTAGGVVRFDSGVANRGGTATGAFTVKWLVDGRVVASGSHAGVPAGATVANGNSLYTWTAVPGTHRITFVVDAANAVAESDETTNSTSVTVTVP